MAERIAIPTRVPLKVYDETIRVMKSAVQEAKLGRNEEMQALKRLDSQARRLGARGGAVIRSPLLLLSARPLQRWMADRIRLGERVSGKESRIGKS